MKIVYLDNSGFAVELGSTLLLFDYYNHLGTAPGRSYQNGVADDAALKQAERVYVLVSHRHFDHYNRAIFELIKINPRIVYILETGIRRVPEGCEARHLSPREAYDDGYLRVMAHPSTDIGVSFQVELEGRTLFHAGDLNCWHWAADCTEQEEAQNRAAFTQALEDIRPHMGGVDVAFFPVDSRMKGPYDDGALEFIAQFRPKLFVPMHFQHNFDVPRRFQEKVRGRTVVFAPAKRGDTFQYGK